MMRIAASRCLKLAFRSWTELIALIDRAANSYSGVSARVRILPVYYPISD
jgi:hypothetical protein